MSEPSATSGPLVVGYDGGAASERALDRAFEEARARDASVVVVVVARIPYELSDQLDPGLGGGGVGVIPPIPPEGPLELQGVLAAARERVEASGIDGTVEWGLGDVVGEILRVANERKASAIIVGKHHHSALGRLLGTDTAADLVREAACDVLVAS
jgi:nucleotide-binding universal stress UspA family protein